jgi:hypothetical protein
MYPEGADAVKPTALGNVFAALGWRIMNRYSISQADVWARLSQVIPTTYGQVIENTNAYMHFLLNSALILFVFILEILLVLMCEMFSPISFRPDVFFWGIPCMLLAVAVEKLALSAACSCCDYVSGCFDLFRHDLLRQMDLPLPQDLQEEKKIWSDLYKQEALDNLTICLENDDESSIPTSCYEYSRYELLQKPNRSSEDETQQRLTSSTMPWVLVYILTVGALIGGLWALLKSSKSQRKRENG